MNNLVERTALHEMKSKYDLDFTVNTCKKSEILFSMYHFGYNLVSKGVRPSHKKEFKELSEDRWLMLLKDLEALMSQLTLSNYKILLNDIK